MGLRMAKRPGRPLARLAKSASVAKIATDNRIEASLRRVEIDTGLSAKLDIVGIQQLGVQHRKRGAHGLAPRRKSAAGLAGCGSRGLSEASLSHASPPGPRRMTERK